jgi:predicted RNA-binding Zn ribbon-like protein
LLPDVVALERWLVAARVLGPARRPSWRNSAEGRQFLKRLLEFREKLRAEIIRQESGASISEAFLGELNRLLEKYPCRMAVQRGGKDLSLGLMFEPRVPEDAWAPIVAAAADLLSGVPKDRVRKCQSPTCTVHFYDTSKKGARRWCSMSLCGNKVKVAAYRQRNRSATSQRKGGK